MKKIKPILSLIILMLIFHSTAFCQGKLYMEEIQFKYKSSSLTEKNIKQIRIIWERLPLDVSVELLLVSEKEIKKLTPEVLVTLSKARADAINLFLTTQKIVSPYDIEINKHSFTENEHVPGGNTSFKRTVRDPYKVYSVVLSKEVPICYNYSDAEKKALNSKEPNIISIDANQDEMIKGRDGVIVIIPANSFNLPIDKKSSDVTIKLWEFLSTEDMVLAGLSTISSGKLLETGGMIYITADYEGTCLKLLRSSKITVKFPTYFKIDSMRLFKGIPFQNIIDWHKTNNFDKVNTLINTDNVPNMEGEMSIIYYALESSGLGWINCDRFSEVDDKIDIGFTCKEKFPLSSVLIFTEINSMMPAEFARTNTNNVLFNNVPKGKEAVVLVFAISADKQKVFYATQKIKIGDVISEEIKLNEATMQDFKVMLKNVKY